MWNSIDPDERGKGVSASFLVLTHTTFVHLLYIYFQSTIKTKHQSLLSMPQVKEIKFVILLTDDSLQDEWSVTWPEANRMLLVAVGCDM